MARIALEEDEELSKLGLLRVSVVANLLKVAPKTVHSWKNLNITKVHGVKYLTWTNVLENKPDSYDGLHTDDAATAYSRWKIFNVVKKELGESMHHQIGAPTAITEKIKIQEFANNVLAKVQKLIPPKYIAVEFTSDTLLDLPMQEAEPFLDLPSQQTETTPISSYLSMCPTCPHNFESFHDGVGCTFARGTVAACKCKHGF